MPLLVFVFVYYKNRKVTIADRGTQIHELIVLPRQCEVLTLKMHQTFSLNANVLNKFHRNVTSWNKICLKTNIS